MADSPLTLSAYQRIVTGTIAGNPALYGAWVVAELSDVRQSGGHCYMELIEKDERGATVAKLRAVIWSGTFHRLRAKFAAATGSDIRTGIKAMVQGSASHHALYGLSFVISDIDPSYTLGDLERLRREILDRLRREGKLELNRQLPPPVVPQRVAVISAGGAAGYGDFVNQIDSNSEGFVFYHFLFPAVMQGERTSASVRAALDMVKATASFWDCVVIIRGGGSTSDLNGFDNYELAERVATFPLPVVVGIGHERDRTVLDEIACVRCKTPTAVAAWLTDTVRAFNDRITDLTQRIVRHGAENLRGELQRVQSLESAFPTIVSNALLRGSKRLDEDSHALERAVSRRLETEKRQLAARAHRLEMVGRRRVDAAESRIGTLITRLATAMRTATKRSALRLENAENMLRVLSPANTLARGYSITRINGHAVRSAADLKPGDVITTRLASGIVQSTVK